LNLHLAEWHQFEKNKAERLKCEIECPTPSKNKGTSKEQNPLKEITQKFKNL
jgi:hypothetical protein